MDTTNVSDTMVLFDRNKSYTVYRHEFQEIRGRKSFYEVANQVNQIALKHSDKNSQDLNTRINRRMESEDIID